MPGREGDAQRNCELDAEGLDRLARLLGDTPGEVRRLEGGAACAVHLVELVGDACRRAVVVKRFPAGFGAPRAEWDALCFVNDSQVPTPEPLAFDGDGAVFGSPAIVMSFLPGLPVSAPEDLRSWTAELAGALAAVHRTTTKALPPSLLRPAIWDRWTPAGLPDDRPTKAIAAAVATLRGTPWERGFCHGDFHPGNVLFDRNGITGVLDSHSARRAPLLSDVGRCRCALAVWPGGDAPELLRAHYGQITSRTLDGLGYWDVLSGAVFLGYGADWLAAVRHALGIELTAEQALERASSFVDDALRQLAA
jgi:aminoglycoside phosphotransferase (APT) family kinase protein